MLRIFHMNKKLNLVVCFAKTGKLSKQRTNILDNPMGFSPTELLKNNNACFLNFILEKIKHFSHSSAQIVGVVLSLHAGLL